jgi:hypothetical protein
VSSGLIASPALAQESEAAETPAVDPEQKPEAPTASEGDAATESGSDAASGPPDRPRNRIVRPDPSDLDDPLFTRGPGGQETSAGAEPAAPGSGAIVCVAGC